MILVATHAPLRADLVTFDQASDLNLFQEKFTNTGNLLIYSPTAGIDNSGGIQAPVSAYNVATYQGSDNLSQPGDSVTVSSFFHLDSTLPTLPAQSGVAVGVVGITPSADDFLYTAPGDARVEVDCDYTGTSYTYEVEGFSTINSGASSNGFIESIPNMIPGDWYQLSGQFTHESGGLDVTLTLNDYGPLGTGFVSTYTYSQLLSDPVGLTSDSQVHGGFLLEGNITSGMDNFQVVAVPEPSSGALLLVTGAGLALIGLRRRSRV